MTEWVALSLLPQLVWGRGTVRSTVEGRRSGAEPSMSVAWPALQSSLRCGPSTPRLRRAVPLPETSSGRNFKPPSP